MIVVGTIIGNVQLAVAIYQCQVAIAIQSTYLAHT